jgi:hypothetical protein
MTPPRLTCFRRSFAAVALLLVLEAPALAAGRLGGGQALEISLGRIVGALLVSITVLVFAVLLIRQRSGRIDLAAWLGRMRLRTQAIDVVEARRLSPHADVCVIRHQGTEYLLLLSAGESQLLSRGPIVEVAAADEPAP